MEAEHLINTNPSQLLTNQQIYDQVRKQVRTPNIIGKNSRASRQNRMDFLSVQEGRKQQSISMTKSGKDSSVLKAHLNQFKIQQSKKQVVSTSPQSIRTIHMPKKLGGTLSDNKVNEFAQYFKNRYKQESKAYKMAMKREAKELYGSFEKTHGVINKQSLQVDRDENNALSNETQPMSSENEMTDDKIQQMKSLETNFRNFQQQSIMQKRAREAKQELYRYYALSNSGLGIGEGGKSKFEMQQKSQQLESMLQSNVKISEEEIAKLFKFKQDMSRQALNDQASRDRVSSQDKIKTAKRKNELQTISSQGVIQKWQMQRKETEYLNWSLKNHQDDLKLQRIISPNTQSDIQSDFVSPKQSYGQFGQKFKTTTPKQLLISQQEGQFPSKSQTRRNKKSQMQKGITKRMAIANIQNIGQSSKIILGPTHLTKDEIREAQYYRDIIQYRQAMSPLMGLSFDQNAAHQLIQRPQSKVQGVVGNNRNFHSIDYTLNNERPARFLPMSYERELVHKLIEVKQERDQLDQHVDAKGSTNRIMPQPLQSGGSRRYQKMSQEDAESVYMPSQRFNIGNTRRGIESTNRKKERINSNKQVELVEDNQSPGADNTQLSNKNMIPIDIKPIVMESMASFKIKQTAKKQAAKMEKITTQKKLPEIEKVNSKDEIKSIEVQVDFLNEEPTTRNKRTSNIPTNRTILSVEQITHRSPQQSLTKDARDQTDVEQSIAVHQMGHIYSQNTSTQISQLNKSRVEKHLQNKDLLHLDFENSFLHITQKDIHSKWKTIAQEEKKQHIAFGSTLQSQPQRNLSINTRLMSTKMITGLESHHQSPQRDSRENNTQVNTALKKPKSDGRTGSQITQEKMTEQGKSMVSQLQPQFQPSLKQIMNQELCKSQKDSKIDGSRTLEPTLEKVGSQQQPVTGQMESTAMFQEYPKTLSPLSSAGQTDHPRKKESDIQSFSNQLQYTHGPVKHEGVTFQVRKLGQRMTMGLNGAISGQGMTMMNVPSKPKTSHQIRRKRDILSKHGNVKRENNNHDIGFQGFNIKREGSNIIAGEGKVGSYMSREKLHSYKGAQVQNIKPILFNSTIDHFVDQYHQRDVSRSRNFNNYIVAKTPSIEDAHSNLNPICLVEEDAEEMSPYQHTSLIQTSVEKTVIQEPFENKSIQAIHDEIEEFENFGSTHDDGLLQPSISRRNSEMEQYLVANGKFEKKLSQPVVQIETNRQDNTFETLSASSANKKEQGQKDNIQTPHKMQTGQSDFHQKELLEIHKSLVPQQQSPLQKQGLIPTNSQIDKSIKRIIGSTKLTEVKRMDNTQQKRAKVLRNMEGLRKSQYKHMQNEVSSIASQQPELYPINSPSVFNISNILPQLRDNINSRNISPRIARGKIQALQNLSQIVNQKTYQNQQNNFDVEDLGIYKIETQNIKVSLRHSSQMDNQNTQSQPSNVPNNNQNLSNQPTIDAEFLGISIHQTQQSIDHGKSSTPMQVEVHSKTQFLIKKNERRSTITAVDQPKEMVTFSDDLNQITKSDEQKSVGPEVLNLKYVLSTDNVNNKGELGGSQDATQNSFMYSRRVLSSKLSPLGPKSCSPQQQESSRIKLVEKQPTNELLKLICQKANLNRHKVRSPRPQQMQKNVDLDVCHGGKTTVMNMPTLPISEKSISKTLEHHVGSDTLIAEDLYGEQTASFSKSPSKCQNTSPEANNKPPQRRVVNSTMSQLAKEKLHEISSLAQNVAEKIPIEIAATNNESYLIDGFEHSSRRNVDLHIEKRKYSGNSDIKVNENHSDSNKYMNSDQVKLEMPDRDMRNDTEPERLPSIESPFYLKHRQLLTDEQIDEQKSSPKKTLGLQFKIHQTQIEKPPKIKWRSKDSVGQQDKVLVIINENSNDIQQMGKLFGMKQNQYRPLPKQNQYAGSQGGPYYLVNESYYQLTESAIKAKNKGQSPNQRNSRQNSNERARVSTIPYIKDKSLRKYGADFHGIQGQQIPNPHSVKASPKTEVNENPTEDSLLQYIQQSFEQQTQEAVPKEEPQRKVTKNSTMRGSALIDERDEFQNDDGQSSAKNSKDTLKSQIKLDTYKDYITPPLSTIQQCRSAETSKNSHTITNTNSVTFAPMKPVNTNVQSAFGTPDQRTKND